MSPSSLQQNHVLKSSLGRKIEHCPDPSETDDEKIKNFLTNKVAIQLGEVT